MPDVYKAYQRSKTLKDTVNNNSLKSFVSSNDGLIFVGVDKIIVMEPEENDLAHFTMVRNEGTGSETDFNQADYEPK